MARTAAAAAPPPAASTTAGTAAEIAIGGWLPSPPTLRAELGTWDYVPLHRFALRGAYERSVPAFADNVLCLVLRGRPRVRREMDGEAPADSCLAPGETHIVPAGRAARWRADGQAVAAHFYVAPRLLHEVAAEVLDGGDPARAELLPRFGERDPALALIGREVLRALRRGQRSHGLWADAAVRLMVARLLARHAAPPGRARAGGGAAGGAAEALPPALARRARAFLDENAACTVNLGELSHEVGVEPLRLVRGFKAAVGLSPYAYLARARARLDALAGLDTDGMVRA